MYNKIIVSLYIFQRKWGLTFFMNCKHSWWFTWNLNPSFVTIFCCCCFLWKIIKKNNNKAVWMTAISPASEWQWSSLKIQGSNWWPSIVTLTLSLHCWVMGSAHHLTKANIWPKFNKYLSKGSGDMEWTWNSRLKLVTFNCDIDLESACLSYGFCISLH